MQHNDDSIFIKEVAYWLPLDGAVFAVRKCLSDMIGAMDGAKRNADTPVEPMSRWFALVHTHECPAFEELCDRIKDYPPGTIPDPHVHDILRLGVILASRTEEVLPNDDTSGNDLRNAITSLYTLACNTPKNLTPAAFSAKVEETRKAICDGFKSLSNGFRKIERKGEHNGKSEPLKVDLSDNAKEFIKEVGANVSGKIEETAEDVNERLDNHSARLKGAEHQIMLARKGNGQLTRKTYDGDVPKIAFWLWIEATVKFGEKHQRDDGFNYFGGKLKDIGIESADEWQHVMNSYRRGKNFKIRDEVIKWCKNHSETSEWRR